MRDQKFLKDIVCALREWYGEKNYVDEQIVDKILEGMSFKDAVEYVLNQFEEIDDYKKEREYEGN